MLFWLFIVYLSFVSDLGLAREAPSLEARISLSEADRLPILPFQYRCYQGDDASVLRDEQAEDWSLSKDIVHLAYQWNLVCETRFSIWNPARESRLVYLKHAFSLTDEISLWLQQEDGTTERLGRAGVLVAAEAWPESYRLPSFPVTLQPGWNHFRSAQTSRDLFRITWSLEFPREFHRRADREHLMLGGFFAICLALSLYNFIMWLVTRDRTQILYVFYLSSYGLSQLCISGILKMHLVPHEWLLDHWIELYTVNTSFYFTSLFVYYFLEVNRFPVFFRITLLSVSILGLFHILASVWLSFQTLGLATLMLGLWISTAVGIVVVAAILRRVPLARTFCLAWSLLILGNFVQCLEFGGILPYNAWTVNANYLGAGLEAILISYAVAMKIRAAREAEEHAKNHAFSQLEKMVYPHQLEAMRAGKQLEETMPLGSSDAYVLCIDLINSSQQDPHQLKNFVREFFSDCQRAMDEGYSSHPLNAHGFRLKEMGDGFLCSVGFPFAIPTGQRASSIALALALRFQKDFLIRLASFSGNAQHPIGLSIGIAYGPLEGYFTLAGTRLYDLFGRGIVLATRYENLRKQFPLDTTKGIICAASAVIERLPPEEQQSFQYVALDPQQTIRDDKEAKGFYILTSHKLMSLDISSASA